jgi:hypothetical protein
VIDVVWINSPVVSWRYRQIVAERARGTSHGIKLRLGRSTHKIDPITVAES